VEVPPYSSQPSQEPAHYNYILDDENEEFSEEKRGGEIDVELSSFAPYVTVGSELEGYSSEIPVRIQRGKIEMLM